MKFSTDTEKFLSNSRQAYDRFKHLQTPFAAVKIYFSGLEGERAKIDDIVGNNFRSETDAILKSGNNFAILMYNTSLQAAEAVVNRISIKLSRLRYGGEKATKTPWLKAYACLYGAGEDSAKLQFRHLELIKPFKNRKEAEKLQPKIREYLRWKESVKSRGHKVFDIKV
jgi:hypothetical protein